MFYTEHDFQVDLENFEFNWKLHAERIQHNEWRIGRPTNRLNDSIGLCKSINCKCIKK